MIPNLSPRLVESSGVTASSAFGISMSDAAHIMQILRDTLYSDKVLAVLREYGSNAWDAHRDAKKHDVPIKVTIPTKFDPTLYIQDFGLGLSHDDMFRVYTQYGASTKRNSDEAVGMLGIGSKSGFAYSDSFTIASRHGGKCRTYVAVLDESEKGSINLLNEEDCDDETGVTIQIPVRPEDIWEFTTKASELFKHFNPRPDINIKLPDLQPDRMRLKHGVIESHSTSGEWIAVMGCVPYRINLDQVTGSHIPEGGIGEHVTRLSGVLYFDIGDVQISASREELKYGTATKKALVKKFNALIDEYVRTTIAVLENNQDFSIWERRVRVQILNDLGLPVPKEFKELLAKSIDIKDVKTKNFTLTMRDGTTSTSSIRVGTDSRLVLRDELRTLSGYQDLHYHDYIIRKDDNKEWTDVEPELEKFVKKADVEGIQIIKLSSLNWVAAPVKPTQTKTKNEKHRVTAFRLKYKDYFSTPWSDHWEIEKRVPTKNDVFIVMHSFQTKDFGHNFYRECQDDYRIAEAFGFEMPTIYGYKSTAKKPVDIKKCIGIHWLEWREKFVKTLLSDSKIKKLLAIYEASVIADHNNSYHTGSSAYTILVDLLGVKHCTTKLIKRQLDAKKAYKKLPAKQKEYLGRLYERIRGTTTFEAVVLRNQIREKYPLLAIQSIQLSELWGSNSIQWADYVKMIDKYRPKDLTPIEEEEDDIDIFEDD